MTEGYEYGYKGYPRDSSTHPLAGGTSYGPAPWDAAAERDASAKKRRSLRDKVVLFGAGTLVVAGVFVENKLYHSPQAGSPGPTAPTAHVPAASRVTSPHAQLAARSCTARRFREAEVEYRLAYEATADPTTFIKMAECYQYQARRPAEAVRYYHAYLAAAPNGSERVVAQVAIQLIELGD
jgi:hypothetical protein